MPEMRLHDRGHHADGRERACRPRPGSINGGMFAREDDIATPVITIDVDDIDAALGDDRAARRQDRASRARPSVTWASPPTSRDSEGNLMGLWQSAG